jgi:hypothetical protein
MLGYRPRFEAEFAFFVVSEGPARFGSWFMLQRVVSLLLAKVAHLPEPEIERDGIDQYRTHSVAYMLLGVRSSSHPGSIDGGCLFC